ncbi:369_t:CDS:2 [Entrophospora sp. SA101]|nr:4936_t:CDS:2 [Entrophospora sp. SA101]CAJ0870981.1 369_t:CDS:2 [Entrophospora sp. SA101]
MSSSYLIDKEELIKSYEKQLSDYDKEFNELLKELSWEIESLEIKQKVFLQVFYLFNFIAHKFPEKSYDEHYKKCELKHHGIRNERGVKRKLPSSKFFYQNASSVVSFEKGFSNIGVGSSLSVDQRLEEYTKIIELADKIRSENNQLNNDPYKNFDEIWDAIQKMKELLAEQRDYKRRRRSYRAKNIRITQRTPTQVHHDLIAAYMDDFRLLAEFENKIESFTNSYFNEKIDPAYIAAVNYKEKLATKLKGPVDLKRLESYTSKKRCN